MGKMYFHEPRKLPNTCGVLLTSKLLLITSGLFLTNHQVLTRLDYFLDFNLYFPVSC